MQFSVYLGCMSKKQIDLAVHNAVCAIYFADNSDYLSALWSVVKNLSPHLVEVLENFPSEAYQRSKAQVLSPCDPTSTEEKLTAAMKMLDFISKHNVAAKAAFDEAMERFKPKAPCRPDGRCQHAIDLGAESEGRCAPGTCQVQCLSDSTETPVMMHSGPATQEEIHRALKNHGLPVVPQSIADMRKALDGFIASRASQ